MEILEAKRIIKFDGTFLPDPDPSMPLKGVLEFYSNRFPEITTGSVKDSMDDDGNVIYEIEKSFKSKG